MKNCYIQCAMASDFRDRCLCPLTSITGIPASAAGIQTPNSMVGAILDEDSAGGSWPRESGLAKHLQKCVL